MEKNQSNPVVITVESVGKDKELQEISKQIPSIIQRAQAFQVNSNEDIETGAKVCAWCRTKIKRVEAIRTALTGPLNDHIKKLNSFFKTTYSNALNETDTIVENKMLVWRRKENERITRENAEREAEALRKQKEAEAKAKKKGTPVSSVIVDDAEPELIEEQSQSVDAGGFRKEWTYSRALNIKGQALDIKDIDSNYLMIDDKKVKSAIREGTREIKGLRIFQEETFARR